MPRMGSTAAFVALLLATHALGADEKSNSDPFPPGLAQRVDEVFADLDKPGSPGCAVGIYRRGEIAYTRAYGLASVELDVPITPATVFDVGSVSKQFTAMSVLLLVRDGKLSLDDDVRRWLPQIPRYARPISVRNLLHHTGGLRDYTDLMALRGENPDNVSTNRDAVALLSRQRGSNFAPGTDWLYCNSCYVLLAEIVQRASGLPFRQFVRERIFAPLGMVHSDLYEHTKLVRGRASGYSPAPDGGLRFSVSYAEEMGDGMVLTSIEDLARWDRNFYEPVVGDADLIAQMQTPGTLTDGRRLAYGAGLFVGERHGRRMVWHSGATVGYVAELDRFPESGVTIAVLCNVTSALPWRRAYRLAEILLPELDPTPPSAPSKGVAALPEPTDADLDGYLGSYRNPATGLVRTIVRDGRKLRLDLRPSGLELHQVAPDRFEVRDWVWKVVADFRRGRTGAVSSFELTNGDHSPEVYQAFRRVVPSLTALDQYRGTYTSEELDTEYLITVRGAELAVRHADRRRMDAPAHRRRRIRVRTVRFRLSAGPGRTHPWPSRERGTRSLQPRLSTRERGPARRPELEETLTGLWPPRGGHPRRRHRGLTSGAPELPIPSEGHGPSQESATGLHKGAASAPLPLRGCGGSCSRSGRAN